MGNQWGGTFTFASPQPKCWGTCRPSPRYDRRTWCSVTACVLVLRCRRDEVEVLLDDVSSRLDDLHNDLLSDQRHTEDQVCLATYSQTYRHAQTRTHAHAHRR